MTIIQSTFQGGLVGMLIEQCRTLVHDLFSFQWEELSGLDLNGNAIRYHQVCNLEQTGQDNWARSPFIDAKYVVVNRKNFLFFWYI